MRYISRELQRQFARICLDAKLEPRDIRKISDAMSLNNGTPATAFDQYILSQGKDDNA